MGTKRLYVPDRKGMAFKSGTVYVKNGKVTIHSRHGTFSLSPRFKQVNVQRATIKTGSVGISKKFALVRYGSTVDISSYYSGLPRLKKNEFGVVL